MTQKSNRTLIIPAAGTASRLRGLPKFLLPTHTNKETLIERQISYLRDFFDEILIGINPDFSRILGSVVSEDHQIKKYELSTNTMMETVVQLAGKSHSDNFVLVMPDTYFSDYSEIKNLFENDMPDLSALICWDIKDYQLGKLGQVFIDDANHVIEIQDKNPDCHFKTFWGIAIFSRKNLLESRDADSHIGFLFERLIKKGETVMGYRVSGDYYDCGTQEEYIKMLLKTKI